ncbi:unnamed protein product [Symbiodinium natans]|uniref:CRAL-TRIO domain-containing protein n=1 Tax=Symbiodinium natans TaxID=878477 RepID=A0A812H2X9_9DINO|nr:unnamed protein product [Symbiodinium natans]
MPAGRSPCPLKHRACCYVLLLSALVSGEPESGPARCRLEQGSCAMREMPRDTTTLVVPGSQSRCIFSNVESEYAFQVIPGDTDKLLVFFQGGGACFNDASTQTAPPCLSHLVVQPLVGIFDREHPANPYRKYTIVHINYCSGDLHIGDVVRWYLDAAGQRVEQKGFVNALSAINWARRNVGNVDGMLSSLVIAGSSTGALGAQIWAATLLGSFRYQAAAVLSDSALGIFPEHAQGPLLAGFGLCKTGLLDPSPGLKTRCLSQQLTMQDVVHQLSSDHPHVAIAAITSQQDVMQIRFYNAVCMANMMTERATAADWESKLMDTLESYNKHPAFVTYLISGGSNYFLPVKELFTTNLRGKKNDIPSSGLLLTDWLQNLPVLPGQSISSQCSECAPALRSKTFTAPTARLQQTVPMEIKSRDLPKEKDSKHLPSIHVTPPALESPWWSNLYYTALLLTAGVLSLGDFPVGLGSRRRPPLEDNHWPQVKRHEPSVKVHHSVSDGGGEHQGILTGRLSYFARNFAYLSDLNPIVADGNFVPKHAGDKDSEKLMKEVSEEEMTEFFIYAREVNSAMAELRTRATGHVCRLISANDLTGVSKFPDQSFQNALTGSAKRAVTLYPGYSGPTVLLNLPWLARMLVSILTPLFPGAVREKIKFARGPMAYMKDLEDVIKEPTRGMFVDDLQAVLNS